METTDYVEPKAPPEPITRYAARVIWRSIAGVLAVLAVMIATQLPAGAVNKTYAISGAGNTTLTNGNWWGRTENNQGTKFYTSTTIYYYFDCVAPIGVGSSTCQGQKTVGGWGHSSAFAPSADVNKVFRFTRHRLFVNGPLKQPVEWQCGAASCYRRL